MSVDVSSDTAADESAADDQVPVSADDADHQDDATTVNEIRQDGPGDYAQVRDPDETAGGSKVPPQQRGRKWPKFVSFVVLPALALLLVGAAGYLKYLNGPADGADLARIQSVQAADEGTVAMLSYSPDNVDAALGAAANRLTGSFRDSYTSLIHDVVIPGAREKRISATAKVAAAASVSATTNRAVVLVFVDQSATVGTDAPTQTASVVEVSLEKVGDRWLISAFDPK
ncbi:MAG: hypothetical protein ACRDTS_10590 [Mycobacterium sp.]